MASLVAHTVKNLPAMQETWVWPLGQEDPLEKEMVTHSSILAWTIPWTEEPGRLQSMGSHRVGHHLAPKPPPNLTVDSGLWHLLQPWSSHQPCEPGWVRVDQLRTLNKLAQVIELMCVVAITRTNLSPNLWGFKSSFLQVQFKGELSR